MSNTSSEVRHVVAWLQPTRWITCVALWAVLAVVPARREGRAQRTVVELSGVPPLHAQTCLGALCTAGWIAPGDAASAWRLGAGLLEPVLRRTLSTPGRGALTG